VGASIVHGTSINQKKTVESKMKDFNGKIVWVTGASSGIGKALALKLIEQGADVILSARNVEALNEIGSNSKKIFVLPLDLEKSDEFQGKTEQVIQRYGRIDYLINNGGISQRSEAFETSIDVDRKLMEINYFGNIALTKAVLPYMQHQKSGHIVVMSSISGKFGFFLRSAYAASKHALHGFYESLKLEEEKNRINVTIVCPGKINTNISLNALKGDGKKHGVMDHNQSSGMDVNLCTQEILKGVLREKHEILVGGKEIKAVTLKRLFPKLFWKVIRKQSAT